MTPTEKRMLRRIRNWDWSIIPALTIAVIVAVSCMWLGLGLLMWAIDVAQVQWHDLFSMGLPAPENLRVVE